VYIKEKPEYLERALGSIWDEQTVRPDEIVLVLDGKLTEELYGVIDRWKSKLGHKFVVVALEKNMGLGNALRTGLIHCSNELIARMDTDDISVPDRFEKQLKVFESSDIDVCGSWVSEFIDDENQIISCRKVPEDMRRIVKFAKSRNPINHPSVMYRKSAVLSVGNYKDMLYFEDYSLWVRLILGNYEIYNIQECLVNMRSGYEMLSRRHGLPYAKAETNFYQHIYKLGYNNTFEFMKNLMIRVPLRIVPKKLLAKIYIFTRTCNKYEK
jgi:glycosyltransferase involved in cell wall biosynthesis